MVTKQAWVFAGGEYHPHDLPSHEVKQHDLVIGVDHGVEHCLASDLVPSIIIGDLDSVSPATLNNPLLQNVPKQCHPRDKAFSDLELALMYLLDQSVVRVVILGISGGRSDHMLFNWQLAVNRDWPFALEYIDQTVRAYRVVEGYPMSINCQINKQISLLPLTHVLGATTEGLQYSLKDCPLVPGSTFSLSNVCNSTSVKVSVSDGTLLALVER